MNMGAPQAPVQVPIQVPMQHHTPGWPYPHVNGMPVGSAPLHPFVSNWAPSAPASSSIQPTNSHHQCHSMYGPSSQRQPITTPTSNNGGHLPSQPMVPPLGAAANIQYHQPTVTPAGAMWPSVPVLPTAQGLLGAGQPIAGVAAHARFTAPPDHEAAQEGVPDKTATKALRGEFVPLEDFLGVVKTHNDDDTKVIEGTDGSLMVTNKTVKKRINNFYRWLEAFVKYQDLLAKHFGYNVYKQMSLYLLHILDRSLRYNWSNVYTYDIRHRSDLAKSRSLDFSDVRGGILNSVRPP